MGTDAFDFADDDWSSQPIFRWAGVEVLERRNGSAKVELPVGDHHRGGGGSAAVNGAVLAYLADIMLGAAASTVWDQAGVPQVTITLNLSYLQPLQGDVVRGDARVIRAGRRLCFVEGEMLDTDGDVCATAVATFRRLPPRRSEHRDNSRATVANPALAGDREDHVR